MNRLTLAGIVAMVLASIASAWFAFQNRGSSKPFVVLVIPILAAVATYLWYFYSADPDVARARFTSSMYFGPASYRPVSLPPKYWPFVNDVISWAPQRFPDLTSHDQEALTTHHGVQFAMATWIMATFPSDWQQPVRMIETPSGALREPDQEAPVSHHDVEETRAKETRVIGERWRSALSGNALLPAYGNLNMASALPPDTDIRVVPVLATPGTRMQSEGLLELQNKFCKVSIRTRYLSGTLGLGRLQPLLGLSDAAADSRYSTESVLVDVQTECCRFRKDHPGMPAYRAWAFEILNGLQARFSDEEILKKMEKRFAEHELVAARNVRLSTAESAILDLEKRRAHFVQTGNATELKALLAPDFAAVAANGGSTLNRDEYTLAAAAPNAQTRPDYVSELLQIDEGTVDYWAYAKMARSPVKHKVSYKRTREGWVVTRQVPWPLEEPTIRFRTPLPSESPHQ
jgi:hypothetical protein